MELPALFFGLKILSQFDGQFSIPQITAISSEENLNSVKPLRTYSRNKHMWLSPHVLGDNCLIGSSLN